MADINEPVFLAEESLKIIETVKKQIDFDYRSWGDDSLESVRKEIRDHYRFLQQGTCSYCKQNLSLIAAANCQIEHIVPKMLHEEFMFTPKNLCVICADCNQIKKEQETLKEIPETLKGKKERKQYPRSSGAFKIVHPHFDNWDEHILNFDGLYVDKSMKGHFTIGACRLNRKLHQFGYDESITNDDEISELMNEWQEEQDSMKRKSILKRIKRIS